MNLKFKTVNIQNFMSFECEKFDFSDHSGMNLICGINNDVVGSKNGSGKSNLINTLIFALFGRTLHNINNKNIPNRFISSDKNTEVILDFEADNVPYQVVSGLKKKSCSSYCKLLRLDLPEDDQDISKSSIKLTRQFIEDEIIKCKFDMFLRSIVLTSDQSYNFFKLDKKEKRDFIEQIFDLGVFGEMYKLVHRDFLDNNTEFGKTEREYATVENQLDQIKVKHDSYITSKKDELKRLVTNLKSLKLEYTTLKESIPDEFTNFDEKYNELLDKKALVNDKLTKLNNKKSEVQVKIQDEKISITGIDNNTATINSKISLVNQKIKNIQREIKQKGDHIKKYETLYDNLCDDCKPHFDDKFSISGTRDEINTLKNDDIKAHESEIDKYNTDIETVNNGKGSHLTTIDKYKEGITKIDGGISKVNESMVKVKKAEQRFNELKRDKVKIENDQKRVDAIKVKVTQGKGEVTKLKDEIDSGETPFQDMIETTEESFRLVKSKLTDLKMKLSYLRMIESIVSEENLRKIIVKDLVHLLNNQISIYLNRMGAKFNCVFDENLIHTFQTESGETEYDNFSSGEKMRLSIATSFAFRDFMANRSGIESNVLILDEYMDSNLDTKAINELMNILMEFNVKNHQDIFIVSHRSELNDNLFSRIITVEKNNGISKIKVEELA